MRKHHILTQPAKVADLLDEDFDVDLSEEWQDKAERLQTRRWHKLHSARKQLYKKIKFRRHQAETPDLDFIH